LIAGADGLDNPTGIVNKYYIHGRLASLNTALAPSQPRKTLINDIFGTYGATLQNYINFSNVFARQCLVNGYSNGEVDYVNRKRNLLLEQEVNLAKSILSELHDNVSLPNKQLRMAVDTEGAYIYSNSDREIVYNTEHIIHHLALIKVALIEMGLSDLTSDEFGMAYATIRYRNSLTVNQ